MCLSCVVHHVQRFVDADSMSTQNESNYEKIVEEAFKTLVFCLDQAARFDHTENRFPWAKSVVVLAPQMRIACLSSGKFEAPPQRRMLEFTRNALIRLTSVEYRQSEADKESMLFEALQRVQDALGSLDERDGQIALK